MAEYIKRASAMTICERYSNHCFEQNDSHGQHIADGIFDDITELPTADVVEVVRCKDCIHKVDLNGRVMCNRNARKHQHYDEWLGLTATENKRFCSYGERRETDA